MRKLSLIILVLIGVPLVLISQDKIDLALLNGEWINPNESLYTTFIQAGDGGLRAASSFKPKQWVTYKETQYPKFEFTSESKMKSGEIITYKGTLTILSQYHISFITHATKYTPETTLILVKKGFASANEAGEFFALGKKLGKVVKTKKANLLLSTMPEFTVYDINNVPRVIWDGTDGRFVFYDDRKSYIPRKVDAHEDLIGKFFAYDSLFTPEGFNESYKARFIKKHGGFNASGQSERNYSDAVRIDGFQIYQGQTLIGSFDSYTQGETLKYDIKTAEGKPVSVVLVEKVTYNQTKVSIFDANKKLINTLGDSLDAPFKRHQEAIRWLVKNRFL
jgi:hypothetical protein